MIPLHYPYIDVRRGVGVTICKSGNLLGIWYGLPSKVKHPIGHNSACLEMSAMGRQAVFIYDYDCMHLEHINIHEQYLLLKNRNSASVLSM